MSDCERFELFLGSGRPSGRELEEMRRHGDDCPDCRDLLQIHEELWELGQELPEPGAVELRALRPRVLREVGTAGRDVWGPRVRAGLAAAASLAVFAVGIAVGRGPGHELPGRDSREVTSRLVGAIHAEAASNRTLPDVADSGFTYSNVSFRRVEGGRVALDFDVTTHVQMVEPSDSQVVQDVLVHALLGSSNTGARLKAMSYAAPAMDTKVKEALLLALRSDENLAVRLKALTILSDHLGDERVEAAVLATLTEDESVQMRLLALDYLAAQSGERGRLEKALEDAAEPGIEALRVRLAEYGT